MCCPSPAPPATPISDCCWKWTPDSPNRESGVILRFRRPEGRPPYGSVRICRAGCPHPAAEQPATPCPCGQGVAGCQKRQRRTACSIKSGDLCGGFGFSEAKAEEKQYQQSGLRPTHRNRSAYAQVPAAPGESFGFQPGLVAPLRWRDCYWKTMRFSAIRSLFLPQ